MNPNRDHFTRPTPQPHQWHHKHRDMPWATAREPLLTAAQALGLCFIVVPLILAGLLL